MLSEAQEVELNALSSTQHHFKSYFTYHIAQVLPLPRSLPDQLFASTFRKYSLAELLFLFQIGLSHFCSCSVNDAKMTVMLFTFSLFPTRSSIDNCWPMGSIVLKEQRSCKKCEKQTKMPPAHPRAP